MGLKQRPGDNLRGASYRRGTSTFDQPLLLVADISALRTSDVKYGRDEPAGRD
jgi:hypothetical protein